MTEEPQSTDLHTEEELKERQALPLDDKIKLSIDTIEEFYKITDGKMYVSFSGGKDSTVLLHLVRSVYPNTAAMFLDTGLEFPEITEFVKTKENITWIQPEMSFREVVTELGYPVGGKVLAGFVDGARRGMPFAIQQMNRDTKYGYKKYKWLLDAPFRISKKCCYRLKEAPAAKYFNEFRLHPIIGSRAQESRMRKKWWIEKGEIHSNSRIMKSLPLSTWMDEDIEGYIKKYNLEISPIYNMGYVRTGCAFCMFGIFSDRNRFAKLKVSHPKIWDYCMKDINDGGLGMQQVCDFIGIDSGKDSIPPFDVLGIKKNKRGDNNE